MYVAEKTNPDDWSARLTENVAATIRDRRKALDLTVEQVADATQAVGHAIPRRVIHNLESGRRGYLTVAELLTLAAVLRVPPIDLVAPLQGGPVEFLPGAEGDAWAVIDWIQGRSTKALRDTDVQPGFKDWGPPSQAYFLKWAYEVQQDWVRDAEQMFLRHPSDDAAERLHNRLERLSMFRAQLEALGVAVPPHVGPVSRVDDDA